MADAEAALNDEIARLEAELEKTRLESKLKHLQAELNAVENSGVLNHDEYMVIKELIDDTGEDSYEEYEEEYEEYEEDVSYEEEEYEEYEEEEEIIEEYEEEEIVEAEEIVEEEEEEEAQEQAPSRLPFGNLRKAPLSAYQRKEAEKAATPVTQAPQVHAHVPKPSPLTSKNPEKAPKQETSAPRVKSKVRPPPGKGGKPKPRKDPEVNAKPAKKYPLSRLLARNSKSKPATTADPENAEAAATDPSLNVVKKAAPKKTVEKVIKKPAQKKTAPPNNVPATGGPFTRRLIPNIQPSPPGEETVFEQLLGPKLITNPKLHKCSTKGCVKDQELICLYFAAKWKSDCKRFNPILKDFYYNVAQPNNLEVVYISADRSLIEFKDVYATMPFLAMPAGTTDIKNALTKQLKIIEMPALVVLDDEGSVVSVEGVMKLQELEKGNIEQANQLVDRWKKTRPIPISQVQQDMTLLHGTMERGTVYWQN